MRTVIIVAHPEPDNSPTQQFLRASLPTDGAATTIQWHDLAATQPSWSATAERQLLAEADRIIWQFPFYWYSAPAILKQWQDLIFSGEAAQYRALAGKEFGLVISLGEKKSAYQAGGREQFTLSELLRPYQAFAQRLGWRYLPPLVIEQFAYLQPPEKQALLVQYQQYLTLAQPASFSQQGEWLLQRLAQVTPPTETGAANLPLVQAQLADKLSDYQDLQAQLREIRLGEHD